MILGLKLDRRVIAIVGFNDGEFVFQLTRAVPHGTGRQAETLAKVFDQLLLQLHPTAIYALLPTPVGKTTALIQRVLEERAAQLGTPVKPLSRSDVVGVLGLLPPKTRDELRQQIGPMWPALADHPAPQQRALAEAALSAVVGFMHECWPPV